jgi:hypothetical protein
MIRHCAAAISSSDQGLVSACCMPVAVPACVQHMRGVLGTMQLGHVLPV